MEAKARPLVDEAYARIQASISPAEWKAMYKGLEAIAHAQGLVPIGSLDVRRARDQRPRRQAKIERVK